jgi:hypothetical protein
MTPQPIIVDDVTRYLDCGASAEALASVRLNRVVTLVVLTGPDESGNRHVERTVGSVHVPHEDWRPAVNDASGEALTVLAKSAGPLPAGASFGLRVWSR